MLGDGHVRLYVSCLVMLRDATGAAGSSCNDAMSGEERST